MVETSLPWHDPSQTRPPAATAPAPDAAIAPDCRHYRGDRPCPQNRLCAGCGHYEPYSHRVCIIKLGALGDVIRTACLLPELRRRFPAAQVTWVSTPSGCRMLTGHPMIDRLLPFDEITALVLGQETFQTVISLDKEPQPCALATSLRAAQKLGIGLSPYGTPVPVNPEAEPYFHLGLSDELKFQRNTKTYQNLIYEALGWVYRGQRYQLPVDPSARERARVLLASRRWQPDKPTVGINVGAGHAFANKMLPAPKTVDVVRLLQQTHPGVQILLLGGAHERPVINTVMARLRLHNAATGVIDTGTDHDERSFVALIDACDVVLTGDTMAMHVAIALDKHVVVFFGPTCQQEIDLFGKGQKLVTQAPCAPCYKRTCDREDICVRQFDAKDAADAIGKTLPHTPGTGIRLPVRTVGCAA